MTTIKTHWGAQIECEISKGIGIHVIGLPDARTGEVLLYALTRLQAIGFHLPGKKVVIAIKGYDNAGYPAIEYGFYIAMAILRESGKLAL